MIRQFVFEDYDDTEIKLLTKKIVKILERESINFEDIDWTNTQIFSDGSMIQLSLKCQR